MPAKTFHSLEWRRTASACTGPCNQCRQQCPCPDACRHADDDGKPLTPRESLTFWAWALGVPAGLACLALIAAYWPH